MKLDFECPKEKKIRVILDTDAKNEADDQFAIVQHLLTPKFEVKGLIAAHFEKQFAKRPSAPEGMTMEKSYEELNKLLELMDLQGQYPVLHGAEGPMKDEKTPVMSEGARFIIAEAMKEDPRELYVCSLGAITDIAAALMAEPRIAEHMTVVWIGGGPWPVGGEEFNLSQDITAANIVMASSVPLWQIPWDAYNQVRTTMAELELKVRPYGKVGKYLYQQMVDFQYEMATTAEVNEATLEMPRDGWTLGDQPTVTVLINQCDHAYTYKPAPKFNRDMFYIHNQNNRPIRVYHHIDARMTLEDLFAKLAIVYGDEG